MNKKLLLFVLRVGVLAFLLVPLGCGSSNDDTSVRSYTLQFSFQSTSGAAILADGADMFGGDRTPQVDVVAGGTQTRTTRGTATKDTTDIEVTLFNDPTSVRVAKAINGVHIENGKTTYIYVTFDGTWLNVDATRPAGVQR